MARGEQKSRQKSISDFDALAGQQTLPSIECSKLCKRRQARKMRQICAPRLRSVLKPFRRQKREACLSRSVSTAALLPAGSRIGRLALQRKIPGLQGMPPFLHPYPSAAACFAMFAILDCKVDFALFPVTDAFQSRRLHSFNARLCLGRSASHPPNGGIACAVRSAGKAPIFTALCRAAPALIVTVGIQLFDIEKRVNA